MFAMPQLTAISCTEQPGSEDVSEIVPKNAPSGHKVEERQGGSLHRLSDCLDPFGPLVTILISTLRDVAVNFEGARAIEELDGNVSSLKEQLDVAISQLEHACTSVQTTQTIFSSYLRPEAQKTTTDPTKGAEALGSRASNTTATVAAASAAAAVTVGSGGVEAAVGSVEVCIAATSAEAFGGIVPGVTVSAVVASAGALGDFKKASFETFESSALASSGSTEGMASQQILSAAQTTISQLLEAVSSLEAIRWPTLQQLFAGLECASTVFTSGSADLKSAVEYLRMQFISYSLEAVVSSKFSPVLESLKQTLEEHFDTLGKDEGSKRFLVEWWCFYHLHELLPVDDCDALQSVHRLTTLLPLLCDMESACLALAGEISWNKSPTLIKLVFDEVRKFCGDHGKATFISFCIWANHSTDVDFSLSDELGLSKLLQLQYGAVDKVLCKHEIAIANVPHTDSSMYVRFHGVEVRIKASVFDACTESNLRLALPRPWPNVKMCQRLIDSTTSDFLCLVFTLGAGDCFFQSMSIAMRGGNHLTDWDIFNGRELRRRFVECLIHGGDTIPCPQEYSSRSAYILDMSMKGDMGDVESIQIFADSVVAKHVCVVQLFESGYDAISVYHSKSDNSKFSFDNCLSTFYNGRSHYSGLCIELLSSDKEGAAPKHEMPCTQGIVGSAAQLIQVPEFPPEAELTDAMRKILSQHTIRLYNEIRILAVESRYPDSVEMLPVLKAVIARHAPDANQARYIESLWREVGISILAHFYH